MMTKENVKVLFSAERRVSNFLNHLQAMAPEEMTPEQVDLIMVTFFGATKELMDLLDQVTVNKIPRDELAAAINALNDEIDRYFENRMAIALAKLADKTKN